MRECSKCGQTKPLVSAHSYCKDCDRVRARAHYHANRDTYLARERRKREKRTAEEQAAHKAYQKAWYRENADKVKAQRLKKYGLTLAQFRVMEQAQNGKCAICETVEPLAVDHNHETKQVRGLLCAQCNQALGKFRENTQIMEKAIRYLTTHGSVL